MTSIVVLWNTQINSLRDFFQNMLLQRAKSAIQLEVVLQIDRLNSWEHSEEVHFKRWLLLCIIKCAHVLPLELFFLSLSDQARNETQLVQHDSQVNWDCQVFFSFLVIMSMWMWVDRKILSRWLCLVTWAQFGTEGQIRSCLLFWIEKDLV